MFTRIIVPLDGSFLAEKALPYALKLAHRFDCGLLLLHVEDVAARRVTLHENEARHEVPVNQGQAIENYMEMMHMAAVHPAARPVRDEPGLHSYSLTPEAPPTCQEYLEKVKEVLISPLFKERLEPERLEYRLLTGHNPAHIISQAAHAEGESLLVMATHGRGGFGGLVLDSVAMHVIRDSGQAALVIRPEKPDEPETLTEILRDPLAFDFNVNRPRILVTLDGYGHSEKILKPAVELATKLGTAVHLLRVIPPTNPAVVTSLNEVELAEMDGDLAERRSAAYEYLGPLKEQIERIGLECVRAVRTDDPISEGILNYVHQIRPCLIAMTTHARGRLGHTFLGSVAEDVLKGSHLPVLMLHLPHEHGREASDFPAG